MESFHVVLSGLLYFLQDGSQGGHLLQVESPGLEHQAAQGIKEVVSGNLFFCELCVNRTVGIGGKGKDIISLISEFL